MDNTRKDKGQDRKVKCIKNSRKYEEKEKYRKMKVIMQESKGIEMY